MKSSIRRRFSARRMGLRVDHNGNQVRTSYNVDGNPVIETGTDPNSENIVTRSWEYDTSRFVKKAVAEGFCCTYEYRSDGSELGRKQSGKSV